MTSQPPILRAIPDVGRAWDDPSEDLLFMLLGDIEAGEGAFLIVERTTVPAGHTYARASRHYDGSYTVEHREGDAEHHYRTVVPDMRTAHRLLTGWAFQLPRWKDRATWSPIRLFHGKSNDDHDDSYCDETSHHFQPYHRRFARYRAAREVGNPLY